ncbi:MAG: cysteine desulfurase [Dehalococcoidia bacterium]|nr:cysteine desulfurase [Dehalococcoidia bacterium]
MTTPDAPDAPDAPTRLDHRIYLDHAATTPPDPAVIEAMLPYLTTHWHNPSSIYVEAQHTRRAIDQARTTVAHHIGATPSEIIFTSGGSESDTLALRGVLAATRNRVSPARGGAASTALLPHLITSATEHHAVLDTVEQLEREGLAEVTLIPPTSDGRIDPTDVAAAVRDTTVLVSVMHANNEVGALNPIAAIAEAARAKNPRTLIHTDAVQTVAHLGVHVDTLGVDLLTFTAHKLYGPRGAGALYVRTGTPLQPQIIGGGQEDRRRAGTENTPAIVGFATALQLAAERRESDLTHERALQQRLIDELPKLIPTSAIVGPRDLNHRLPGNVSALIGHVEGESILVALDLAGVAASSGSACTTGSVEPSHVLSALGVPDNLSRGSLRFTFGRGNTTEDVDHLLQVLPPIVHRLRALSPLPTTEPPPTWLPWLKR